jgi:Thioredoxin domain
LLSIKILSLGSPERYAIRRMVTAVLQELQARDPQLQTAIIEIDDADQIGQYASVLVMPTLVINDRVVSSGRFPSRKEIVDWLHEAARDQ